MTFWIIATALAVIAAGLLVLPLLRSGTETDADPRNDIAIYKDQLAEVDRDLARGVLDQAEAERTRTEIARRLLAADKAGSDTASVAPKAMGRIVMFGAAVATVAGALALYNRVGAPGYPDMPRAARLAEAKEAYDNRPSQAEAEAAQPALEQVTLPEDLQATVDRVRQTAEANPENLIAQRDLVRLETALGNVNLAAHAQVKVVALLGDDAEQEDLEVLLELLVAAAGGDVTPEAERVLKAILDKNPESISGLYWAGVMFNTYGRPDRAFPYWRKLLEVAPEDADWFDQVAQATIELSWFAGVDDYTPPQRAGLRGPSAADIAAAGDMSAGDQQAMISGMVANLMDRLATEGGTPQEWAQLIRALGVMGDTDRAAAIWGEAEQTFASDANAMSIIREAAVGAGVAE
jgi:cytochrome c-type biogenesis protein CcmH